MPEAAYKRCTRCGREQPTSEFYRQGSNRKDNLASRCKTCKREIADATASYTVSGKSITSANGAMRTGLKRAPITQSAMRCAAAI